MTTQSEAASDRVRWCRVRFGHPKGTCVTVAGGLGPSTWQWVSPGLYSAIGLIGLIVMACLTLITGGVFSSEALTTVVVGAHVALLVLAYLSMYAGRRVFRCNDNELVQAVLNACRTSGYSKRTGEWEYLVRGPDAVLIMAAARRTAEVEKRAADAAKLMPQEAREALSTIAERTDEEPESHG